MRMSAVVNTATDAVCILSAASEYETDAMKQKLLCFLIIILFCGTACSKGEVIGVLDDISRDTYENRAKERRIDNLGDPVYEAPPTYDQYQRERNNLISTQDEASTEAENDK